MGGSPGMMADVARATAADSGKASTGNFQYTPPTPSPNGRYVPQYTQISPTPFLQSVLAQQNPSLGGLSNLYGNLFNSPQQPAGIQQLTPMQPYVGSTYRPNMAAVRQNLNNVAPSVQEQQRLQAIEDARIRAEQEAYDAAHPQPTYQDYGGGG